jgi:hypothetical protein
MTTTYKKFKIVTNSNKAVVYNPKGYFVTSLVAATEKEVIKNAKEQIKIITK